MTDKIKSLFTKRTGSRDSSGDAAGSKQGSQKKTGSGNQPDKKRAGNPKVGADQAGGQADTRAPPPATQRRTTKNQSALKPGNETGFKTKKGSDNLVQFGPVLKEFLNSKELVNKSLVIKHDQTKDQTEVDFTFSTVLANGVSVAPPKTLKLEEYLAQRNVILKKKDASSLLVDFTETLLIRIGVDVTSIKPSVDPNSVKAFIMKHLSPVEREIIRLTPDEYNQIDTDKLPKLLAPSKLVIEEHYGGGDLRTEHLITQINSTNPQVDFAPPNWVQCGVLGISKGTLLESMRIEKKFQFTDDQKASFDMLRKQLNLVPMEESKVGEPLEVKQEHDG